MMTQRKSRARPWPTVALHARDHSIMELTAAKHQLRRLVKEGAGLTELEQLRCAAIALGSTAEALRLLQGTVEQNGNNVKGKTNNDN